MSLPRAIENPKRPQWPSICIELTIADPGVTIGLLAEKLRATEQVMP